MTPEREADIRDMVRYTGRHGTPWRTAAEDLLAEVDRLREQLAALRGAATEMRNAAGHVSLDGSASLAEGERLRTAFDRLGHVLTDVAAAAEAHDRRVEERGARWALDACYQAVLDDHAPPVSPADDQRARTAVQICDKARAAERDKGTR